MKLRLNKSLRAAVMACCVAALSITTAKADFVWNGGTISAEDWAAASSWTLSNPDETITVGDETYRRITINDNNRFVVSKNDNGTKQDTTLTNGPATAGSNAWDKIVINGATGTTANLEGWAFKMDVKGLSTVTTTVNKLQGSSAVNVEAGSTLNLTKGTTQDGNDGGAFDVTLGGTLNMYLYKNKGGGVTTVDYGTLDGSATHGMFNIYSSSAGTAHTYNSLTITATLGVSSTTEETTLSYIDLGTYSDDITVTTFNSNITADGFTNAGNTTLTATEANIGKYSLVQEDGKFRLYYVTGTLSNFTWNGTEANHVWNAENTNWLAGGSDTAYNSNANLIFADGASTTVTMTGGDYSARSIELQADYTFEVAADSTLAVESMTGDGRMTKTGDAKLTMASGLAAKVAAVNAGTLAISDRLTGDTFGGGMTVGADGTLEITCVADGRGTQLVLADGSKGTVQINGGKLRVDSEGATKLGGTKLVLADGTTLNFANSENGRTSTVSNNIEASGTLTLQTWGDATRTANNIMSGNITGTANIVKNDGGTLNLTGSVAANSIKTTGGVLKLSGNVTTNQLFVSTGTTEITGGMTTATQVRLSENGQNGNKLIISGGTLKITGTDNRHETSASLLLAHWGQTGFMEVNGGTLEAAGTEALISWTGTGTLSVNGGTAKLKGMNFWGQSGLKGTFNLGTATTGDGVLELGSTGFHEFGSGATINLGNGTIKLVEDSYVGYNVAGSQGSLNLIGTNGGTKFDTNGKNMTIGVRHDNHDVAATMNVAGGGALVKAGEGTLTFNGTLEAGAITIEAGTLQLNGATTIGQAIVNDGELSFGTSGKLVITDLSAWTPSGAPTYSDEQAPESGNGYLNTSYEVVKGSGTISGAAVVTVNNEDKTLADGMLVYAGNGGTYYVKSGEVVYAEGTTAASEATTGISMDGGSLTVQKELTHNVSLAQDSTVAIGTDGVVDKSSITTDGHTLTITGEGKYTTTEKALGATLGEGWTGTVTVGGLNNVTDFDISAYGNADSTVEINGVKGYLVQARGMNGNAGLTYAQNIKFTDNGDAKALEITNGWPDNNGVPGDPFTFTGKISGEGTLYHNTSTNKTITFSGDVSEWSGAILTNGNMGSSRTMTYEFTGDATAINAAFTVENGSTGTVDLKITNDKDVTVGKAITDKHTAADARNLKLTLSGDGTKTFNADVTVASTTIEGGDMQIANGATFTTGVTAISQLADDAAVVSVNEGATGAQTVDVANGNLTFAAASITVKSDSSVETAATLNNSKLTVLGANGAATDATVTVNVAEGSTNDFDASKGSITVNAQSASIGDAAIGAGKTLTIGDGTGAATVSGTATIADGGTVSGDLTIADGGKLQLSSATETGFGAIVEGTLTFQQGGTATLTGFETLDLSAYKTDTNLVLATAVDIKGWAAKDVNDFFAGTVILADKMQGIVKVVPYGVGQYDLTAEGATGQQLVIELTKITTSTTLTLAEENPAAWVGNALQITVAENLTGVNGDLALSVDDDQWGALVAAVQGAGKTVGDSVAVTLVGADGKTIDLANPGEFTGTVAFNGYVGEGNGTYQVQFIPEPTTATLSLLALAGLAARRRRKASK